MKREINNIKIIANDNALSQETKIKLTEKLINNGFSLVEDNYDLVIAIGGDGSCLRSIKKTSFSDTALYVGINSGTLGFLQEVKLEDIDKFVDALSSCSYQIDYIGIQETVIETKDTKDHYYSLNEIVIRERDLNTVILDIDINNAHLEKYIGDGILIATSIGSTAYNLSFGGSIVYNSLHTLQITPIAPLNNNVYRNLINSIIIPEQTEIKIKPLKKDLLISVDGENIIYNDVISITTYVKDKRIKFLRMMTYNFYEKINDKFLNK